MSVRVEACLDKDRLAASAASFVAGCIGAAITERGRAVVALAGGSTPGAAYKVLAQPDSGVDWSRTYLFLSDERFVPADDPVSNYGMARASLLEPARVPVANIFPVSTGLETAALAAREYEAMVLRVLGASPVFDLIMLGLGDDGHTASLFPGAPSLHVKDRWVVDSPPGTLPPPVDRVTFTFPLINAARQVLFLVAGKGKSGAVHDVLEGDFAIEQRPAVGVKPSHGNVTWLLDPEAASLLSQTGKS